MRLKILFFLHFNHQYGHLMILQISSIYHLFLKCNNPKVTLHFLKIIQFCKKNLIFAKKFIWGDYPIITDSCKAFQRKVSFNSTLNYRSYL
jgi:hypothetical protein